MQGLFFVFFGLLVLVELKLENQKIRQHYLFFKWIRGRCKYVISNSMLKAYDPPFTF